MENNIIYAVCTRWWHIGQITEHKIIKETEKLYIVTENNRHTATNRVRKENMEVYDLHFCLTYEEALQYKIELCEKTITNNEKQIEEAKKNIEKATAMKHVTVAELRVLKSGGDASNG